MKTKVVIIDDHALFNDGLAHILSENARFEVVKQVYESRSAVFDCQKYLPNLILVDYNMPGIDGLEVVKQLRELNGNYKIVVISMYADKKEIQRFVEAGVDGYLTKTIPQRELLSSLEKVMKGEKVFSSGLTPKIEQPKDPFQMRFQLTKRELEILRWIKKEASTAEIAQELSLSYFTVETHRKNINLKLKSLTRTEYLEFLDAI